MLGFKSAAVIVSSGVSQGSHLSFLLFLLFVNGIKNDVHNCKFLLFADNFKLFLKIKSESDNVVPYKLSLAFNSTLVKANPCSFPDVM